MKKYYVVGYNDEYLSRSVYAEGTDKEAIQTAFFDTVRKELSDDTGMNSDEASLLIMRSLSSQEDVDPCLSINNASSATIRYGAGYETCIDVVEREVKSYLIKENRYGDNGNCELYLDHTKYESLQHGVAAAGLLAFKTASEMNEQDRSMKGAANTRWYDVCEQQDDNGYGFVLRHREGETYQIVRKYWIVEDI